MHTFSIDNDTRLKLIAILGVVSYLLTGYFNTTVIPHINGNLPSGVSIPSVITFGVTFVILFEILNRCVWKISIIPTQLISVPDLNGHWQGYIWTDYQGGIEQELIAEIEQDGGDYTAIEANLHIEQTWSKINIYFETDRSPSNSTGASFKTKGLRYNTLSYQFQNEGPNPLRQSDDEGEYGGAAEFKYKTDQGDMDILEGFYFTGPSRRNNSGAARFERIDSESEQNKSIGEKIRQRLGR